MTYRVHYVLHVNDRAVSVFEDIDSAKAAAMQRLSPGDRVHIESFAAPARSKAWRYDPEVDSWVTEEL